MSKLQFITVRVPDDFENPDVLIRGALEHYLQDEDRWRLVEVTGGTIIDDEGQVVPR